jgi:shikimate dehydrogenase
VRNSERALVGLIGWPVEHSISPSMHNAAFREMGIDWHYQLLPTPAEQLESTLAGLEEEGYRGVNVTVPHKQAVIPYLDRVADAVRGIGAVNTIVVSRGELVGHNTDGDGFLQALQEEGLEPQGKRALVLGAGGAARAVVYSLAQAGCSVTLHNRTAERAQVLAAQMRDLGVGAPVTAVDRIGEITDTDGGLSRLDLLVNATALGMSPATSRSPWPEGRPIPRHWAVFDLVYNPKETRLLAQARSSGAQAIGGSGMLVHQGALALELWTGQTPPVDVMRRAAERALAP